MKGKIIILLSGLVFNVACSGQTAESPTPTPQSIAELAPYSTYIIELK